MFIFTFFTTLDRNLKVVKIGLFILFLSFYFAFTALFFNDSIMRKIYEYKGNTDAAVFEPDFIGGFEIFSLPSIILSKSLDPLKTKKTTIPMKLVKQAKRI